MVFAFLLVFTLAERGVALLAEPAALTTLSNPSIPYTIPDKPYVIIQRGDVQVVVVDNQAVNDQVLPRHRAGYNGIASLTHTKREENLFKQSLGGLNFEFIHDGTVRDRSVLLESRKAPMQLRRIDQHTVELCQGPTPHWGLESCSRFHLLPDGTIEMTFVCIPHKRSFKNGYIGLFWASYIHQPESLDIHFLGYPGKSDGRPRWIRGASPAHGQFSTHLGADDHRVFHHDPDFPLTLVFNLSEYRYREPWYYGVSHGMTYALFFRDQDRIRLTQSPSGGGHGNPAWDFQFFISDYEVGKRYHMMMRAMYVPAEGPLQIQRVSEPHRLTLNPNH